MAANLTGAYIYPLKNPSDVLNMWLYPDSQEETYTAVIPSESHPSLGYSVSQTFGRESPKRSFSLLFDDVMPNNARVNQAALATIHSGVYGLVDDAAGGTTRRQADGEAEKARQWIRRNLGPDFDAKKPGAYRAQYFRVKLLGPPVFMAFSRVKCDQFVVAKDTNKTRRFRASFEGEEAFPVDLNPKGLSGGRRKKAGETRKEGEAVINLVNKAPVSGVFGTVAAVFAAVQGAF